MPDHRLVVLPPLNILQDNTVENTNATYGEPNVCIAADIDHPLHMTEDNTVENATDGELNAGPSMASSSHIIGDNTLETSYGTEIFNILFDDEPQRYSTSS